jgi:hypothetical protein
MDSSKNLEAVFEKIESTLTVRFSSGGSATGSGYYPTGSSATIEAIPYEGYSFVRWDGSSTSNSNSSTTTIEMTCDMEVKAIFQSTSLTPTPTVTETPTTEFSSLSCFIDHMSTPTSTHREQDLQVNCPQLIVSGSPYFVTRCFPPTPIPTSGPGSSPLYSVDHWGHCSTPTGTENPDCSKGYYIGEEGAYDFDGVYNFHSYNSPSQEAIYYSSATPLLGLNVVKGKIIHYLINPSDPTSGVCEMVGDVEFYRSDYVNTISFETNSTPLPIPVYSDCSDGQSDSSSPITYPLSTWGNWGGSTVAPYNYLLYGIE